MLEESTFYGAVEGTIYSILLSVLPTSGDKYQENSPSLLTVDGMENKSNATLLLYALLKCFHEKSGFSCMEVCICMQVTHNFRNLKIHFIL